MTVDIQKLIQMITAEVISQLSRMGVQITSLPGNETAPVVTNQNNNKSKIIDMNGYRTPVLTENQVEVLESDLSEIIIPKGTVITPGAKDLIKKRNLSVNYKIN